MDNEKEKTGNKKPNYILLSKIITTVFSVIFFGLGIFGLFGLTKINLKQSKTEGTVIGISLKEGYEIRKNTFIYTIEYTADDGVKRQYEAEYTNNKYLPFETMAVWYFSDSKEANADYGTGWLLFGICIPIGIILALVSIFVIKNREENDEDQNEDDSDYQGNDGDYQTEEDYIQNEDE